MATRLSAALSVSAQGTPVLRAVPDHVTFPDTVVGSRRTATLVLDNPGAVAVPIGSVSVQPAGAGFSIRRDRCSSQRLGVGESSTVEVVFSPTTPGDNDATLEITGPTQPLIVPLFGHAGPAQGLVPQVSDLDFGNVSIGQSSPTRGVQFTNRASTPAAVSGVVVIGPDPSDLNIVDTTCTGAALQPGDSCVVQLQFTPSAIGTRSATLTTTADVVTHEASLHGIGTGAEPAWTIDPVDFGNTNVGAQTPPQTASLLNGGNATLAIQDVDVIGDAVDFVRRDMTPGISQLPPGGILGFQLRFKPTAVGTRRAELRVHSDSPASPHVLTLSGIGQTPP